MDQSIEIPRRRIYGVLAVLIIFVLVLMSKLFTLQVSESPELAAKAAAEHWQEEQIPAKRGRILDAHGRILASNVNADRLYAVPKSLKDIPGTADVLAAILGGPRDKILETLSREGAEYVLVNRRLTPEESERVKELKLSGLFLEPEPKRVYPGGVFAAHLLGFSNYENVGSYGLEGAYNSVLEGKPGTLVAERDTAGNAITIGRQQGQAAEDGSDLTLTINSSIQYIAERELDKAIFDTKATGGTIVVMDTRTGGILAMVSRPVYDPNAFDVTDQALFKDPAVSSIYEPGSTFKLITMASGLQENAITPDTTHLCTGSIQVGGFTISTWNGQAHGQETMTEVLMHSCNLGASFVSNLIGKDSFYQHVKDFGFGKPTGVDLQGEIEGLVKWPDVEGSGWSNIDLYTNSFGQGISVTPVQMATAISAIANNGRLMKPHLVQAISRDGNVVKESQPEVVKQVVSPEAASTLLQMMVDSVDYGEFQMARVPGYEVGGKTGTASIPKPDGGYDPKLTIASFVGVAPASDPRFTILVKIDKPQSSQWGSQVAAPVFSRIAKELFVYEKIPPTRPIDDQSKDATR